MFLVTFYNANKQFPIFSENPLHPLQEINSSHNITPLQNQNFLIHHNTFFTKISLPPFWKMGIHARTLPNQLAPKQITNLQAMTT